MSATPTPPRAHDVAVDLYSGAAAGVVADVAATAWSGFRDGMARPFAGLDAVLGLVLLAAVLGSLAVLVGLLDESERDVVRRAGSVPYALRGYQAASFTSALTMVVGLVAFVTWNSLPVVLQGTALGLATGCLVWSAFGTARVLGYTGAYRRATGRPRVGGGT